MVEQIIYGTGVIVVVAACVSAAALAVIGCALLCNRAVRHVLDSYGGWKVFLEYREWYLERKRNRPTAQGAGDL